ncbi:MAG: DUF1059 domain-containing protein [Gammaproteobacteria bacterium]|uniref:DUF1059 domain-containing protein n=1 Tax=Oceanicoccus sp. TaxID=2691044 RepID=UPI002626C246|nr:DUF1059 domain-containing protein [Oceanicoccus sp.]MCP3908417.1 DUF1059 domain-containing protein [Oceanicoccus sp.]MCP4089473.1 DUF1059 domain-containing protein [Gammaproteobacteria bacterium]MCP4278284.1 DUF1059 domain-containing protein [Gammaproteobacteria bacterium]MCP4833048.1 DUF1059 domain-containing protein [Gammaproteobacteria bacterium]
MKTMSCRQLGGACDKEFRASTFEEMAELSQHHGKEMRQKKDAPHLEVMRKMQDLIKDPEKMQKWLESKKEEFEALPED